MEILYIYEFDLVTKSTIYKFSHFTDLWPQNSPDLNPVDYSI